jgi:hypothetical protein
MNIIDTRLARENFYVSFFLILGLQRREKKAWQSLLNVWKFLEDVGYSCSCLKKNLKDCFNFVFKIIAFVQILVCNIPVFATVASLYTTYSRISLVDRLPLIYLIERVIILNENKTYHNHAIFRDCSHDSITYAEMSSFIVICVRCSGWLSAEASRKHFTYFWKSFV